MGQSLLTLITTRGATSDMKVTITLIMISTLVMLSTAKPWYQGDGLGGCAPGKCPQTAEISPIRCSSDLKLYFNNGFPTRCGEGEECDSAEADAANGNPCRPVAPKK